MNSKLVAFPPQRKQFLFSPELFEQDGVKLMYTPYTKIASFVWYLVKKVRLVRSMFTVGKDKLPSEVASLLLEYSNYQVQVNMGTEGPEQKRTLLLTTKESGVFIKLGTSLKARSLIQNEYNVLKSLKGQFGSPHVIECTRNDESTVLKTTCVLAEKRSETKIDNKIFEVLLDISRFSTVNKEDFIYVFNHGDFCPWNILESDNKINIIDWEMAGEYPLGYDLFTFIFQTNYHLFPGKEDCVILNENMPWLAKFFETFTIRDFSSYLIKFAQLKHAEFLEKEPDSLIALRFKNLTTISI